MVRRALTIGFVLALMLSVTACSGSEPDKLHPGEARVPASSEDLEGKPYADVVDTLKAAGFDSIETNALDDLITGWVHKPDEVDKVKIGGTESFVKGEVFKSGAKIIISYHSFPKKNDPSPEASNTSKPENSTVDLPYWCHAGFVFGNAAPIELRYTKGNIPVTVTVESPTELPTGSNPNANASFKVTISNLSAERVWDPSLYALAVAVSDKEKSVVNFGEWPTGYGNDDVGPGQSLTFTDEWNVADLSKVRYELRVDGLAGDTVCFTK